tara:strand:+ start:197 stop:586 length:390 start_codon:yes stop_codon:yes gene_type:complete
MSRKAKGMNAERDLVHKFWNNEWSAIRVAGSGSMKYPAADVLATNKARSLAIECKTSKDPIKYISHEDMEQLKTFASLFNAEPWLAVKFNNQEWFFLNPEDITEKTEKAYCIRADTIQKKGVLFEEVIK